MKNMKIKRFLAITLAVCMAIPSFPAQAKAAGSEPAQRAGSASVPDPFYEFTFDNVTEEGAGTVENEGNGGEASASIDGSKEGLGVFYDEERASKVLNLPGGDTNGATEGRLTLPDNMFQSVTNAGFAFSFWINIDESTGSYSRIFSGTVNGQNSDNGGGNWDAPEFAFVAGGGDYVTTVVNSDKSVNTRLTWDSVFARGQWQHVTLSVSPAAYDVYLDGVKTETHVVNNYADLDTLLAKLFADDAAELKKYVKCAIGSSVYKTDKDLKAKIDEFRFYNTALTAEQAKAAHDSYAVDEALIAALQAKIDEAKAKSISFYTEESYAALKPAIEAGERGVANPTTAEYVTNLTDGLQKALDGLTYYAGVSGSTKFSNAQLAAENQAAKKIVSDGGLSGERRQKVEAAADAADTALALTDENAESQAAVDKALTGLREAVGGLGEEDLAAPVINKQPIKAVYQVGDKAVPLTVDASVGVIGDNGGSLTYQWYSNTEKRTEGGAVISGATDKTYIPSVAEAGRTYYYCEVTNTNAAIPGASKTTYSNVVLVRVNGTEETEVPQPYYEFTFDVTSDNGTEVTNIGSKVGATAQIEGTKEGLGIAWDEGRASKVLNLPGGDTNGAVEGRLSLPENMFADVTDAGFAFSFWINIDENATQYSRIFSGTVNGQNSDNGGTWDAPEFSFVVGSETASDMEEGKAGYNTAAILPDKTELKLVWEEQFAKGKWQHVTISVSPDKYDVYLDGEQVGVKYDRNSNMSTALQTMFANDAAILKQYADCAIGSSVYKTDKDLKAKVDEFRFYNSYLTMEQAEAAYDSYAVDKSLVAELQEKVEEAKNLNASISFYTRDSYEAFLSAIAEGEKGIENPVTEEYVRGLLSKLDAAVKGLKYYNDSINVATSFSKVQLEDETDAANILIREGGLTSASESAISEAIKTAEAAAQLTGTEANAQATVDAALKALRAAVDAASYEEAAATPQIANEGQPKDAVYTKGDTMNPAVPLTVTATVSDKGTLSYQWYRNTVNSVAGGTAVEGAVQAAYTPLIAEAGTTYYYCEVTNTQNKATVTKTAQATSNVAAVTVKETETPVIHTQWSNAVYEIGETATALTVEAAVTDGGTLSYQWYQKLSEDAEGEKIAAATGNSYTPSTETLGETYYYCVVTNTIGTAMKSAESSCVFIRVVTDKSAVAVRPTITKEPEDAEYMVGDAAQALAVEAAVNDGGTLSYQWYKNTSNSTVGGTIIENGDCANYTPSTAEEGISYYYCIVTNTKGSATETAASRAAKVTVAKGNGDDRPSASEPEITKQPAGKTYAYGQKAKALEVSAAVSDGGTISYQWYQNKANSTEGASAIKDATKATYTPALKAVGTVYYFCAVTNTKGSETAVTNSNVVAIKVTKAANSITGISAKMTVVFGKSPTLKAKGQGAVTYTSSDKKVLTVGKSNGKIKTVGYGKAQIAIKAAGNKNYNSATRKITVTVKPKKMAVPGLKSAKKKTLTVTWKKDAKASGYKIQYSTDKNFKKSVKTTAVKKNKTTKTTLKNLKAGKKYYVRICAYKGSGKNQVCSDWSKAKALAVKKK